MREEWEARLAIAAVDEVMIVSWDLPRLSEASYSISTADHLFEGRDIGTCFSTSMIVDSSTLTISVRVHNILMHAHTCTLHHRRFYLTTHNSSSYDIISSSSPCMQS